MEISSVGFNRSSTSTSSLHGYEDIKTVQNKAFDAGWNAALDHASARLENDFRNAFGKDTLSGIAIYLKELKK